jgi:hypothetical protein
MDIIEKLVLVLFSIGLWTLYITAALLVHGLIYQLTGISILRSIDKGFKKLEVYVDKNF